MRSKDVMSTGRGLTAVVLWGALVSCGESTGSRIGGKVRDRDFYVQELVFDQSDANHLSISFGEPGGLCAYATTAQEPPEDVQWIGLGFCWPSAIEPGVYHLSSQPLSCPTPIGYAALHRMDVDPVGGLEYIREDIPISSGSSIEITELSPERAAGRIDFDFEGEIVEGTFVATRCAGLDRW
jgi:hypothetical protein